MPIVSPRDDRNLRPAWAEIDPGAIAHNLAVARRLAGSRRLIASVKANGYGHGAVAMAAALTELGVDCLWTGSLDEAVQIRAAGVASRIIIFGGYAPDQIPDLLRHDLVPTIYDEAGAQALAAAAREPAPVFIKVDSGLGRLGVPVDDAFELVARIAAMPAVRIEGIYTHLPFGDAAGRDWALGRYPMFDALLARLVRAGINPPVTQAWASSGLMAGLTDRCNAVCVGHLLYGLSPVDESIATIPLQPVLASIKSRLIQVVDRAAGSEVASAGGYGGKNARKTGVVALGLGDGMRNARDGQTMSLLIKGRRAPVLGVSLEHMTLDLTAIESARTGDDVVIVGRSGGERNSFKDLARWFGCGELEAVMAFSKKLPVRAIGR
jgi:alanine racemase